MNHCRCKLGRGRLPSRACTTSFDARCLKQFFVCSVIINNGPVKTWIALYHSISLSITAGALWGIGYSGNERSTPKYGREPSQSQSEPHRWPAGFPNQNLEYNIRQLSFVYGRQDHHCLWFPIIFWSESFYQSRLLVVIILTTNFPKYLSLCLVISVVIISSLVWAFRAARCRMIKGRRAVREHDILYLHSSVPHLCNHIRTLWNVHWIRLYLYPVHTISFSFFDQVSMRWNTENRIKKGYQKIRCAEAFCMFLFCIL